MEDRGRGDEAVRMEDSVRWRRDVGARHQHVGSVREVRDRGRVGQGLGVVGLVVVIGQVVQHIPRVVWGGQALGVGVLSCQIVGHLGFVCSRQVVLRSWGHIGLRAKTKHCVQTTMIFWSWSWSMVSWSWRMVSWLWCVVSWSWRMVSWLWSMVNWLWGMVSWFGGMIFWSWMIGRMNTKYFL